MSALGESLNDLLSNDSSISGMVDSISSVVCKNEEATNFIVFYLDGIRPEDDNDVFGKSGTFSYRIMIVHEEYAKVEELQTAVLSLLNGFTGVNSGNDIREVMFKTAKDDWAEELERYARYIHFDISLNETT